MKQAARSRALAQTAKRILIAASFVALVALIALTRGAKAAPLYTLVVTALDDASVTNCTLRDAITAANINSATGVCLAGISGADTIAFSVVGTITLTSTLPAITDTLTIVGPPGGLAISGNNSVRVMTVNSGVKVDLQNLAIINGNNSVGGGIRNIGGILTITDSTLSSNTATGVGGAIYNLAGTITINNSTLSGNSAANDGGGIDNDTGSVTIINSTFSGNSAPFGGSGIANSTGSVSVVDSTFYNNTSSNGFGTGVGGGIFISSGTVRLTNSTFSNDAADSGAGVSRLTGLVTLQNTIIANSTSGGNCGGGSFSDGGYNLEDSNSCGLSAGGSLTNTNPLLSAPGFYGGPTQTMGLLLGSPARNAANTLNCPVTNQRGVYRLLDALCDIGAYEGTLRVYYFPFIAR